MSSFSEGFLDAPLLSDMISERFRTMFSRSETERVILSMDDRIIHDLGISRSELLRAFSRNRN